MKRLILVALFAALPLLAQDKISLENRVSPAPSGTQYAIPYATTTTTIGWLAHATGLQCMTQNGAAVPTWGTCYTGTVTAVSVATANGFAGTSGGGATPILTLTTGITGMLKGNGTAISAATVGTDYSIGTGSLGTGILKSTATSGALSIAAAGDFPTLNQDTTGLAVKATILATARAINGVNFDGSAPITVTADANTLSGTTLKSTVVNSSLTTVTPQEKLDVKLATDYHLQFTKWSTIASEIYASNDAGSYSPLALDGSVLSLNARTTGNVGIGTTAPTAKLQVVGLVDYANNTAATAAGLTAGAFYTVTSSNPKQVAVVY
jgi:hypothetical protein